MNNNYNMIFGMNSEFFKFQRPFLSQKYVIERNKYFELVVRIIINGRENLSNKLNLCLLLKYCQRAS